MPRIQRSYHISYELLKIAGENNHLDIFKFLWSIKGRGYYGAVIEDLSRKACLKGHVDMFTYLLRFIHPSSEDLKIFKEIKPSYHRKDIVSAISYYERYCNVKYTTQSKEIIVPFHDIGSVKYLLKDTTTEFIVRKITTKTIHFQYRTI